MSQEFRMELSPPIKKSSQEIKGDEDKNSAIPSTNEAPKRSPKLDAAHTPPPWERRGTYIVATKFENVVVTQCCGRNHQFQLPDTENEANADLIVAAVNAYVPHRFAAMDALVDALLQAKETIRIWHGEPAWDTYDSRSPEMRKINAALKLANGQDTDTGASPGTD